MNKIVVQANAKKQTYPIIIGEGILRSIETHIDLSSYGKIVIITDTQVEKVLLKNMPEFLSRLASVITLPCGERAKTLETITEIWKELLILDCDRSTLIINIGGGVISDAGGFAASTFLRGVDFINVPTTLLSQVDASVGGKTGINFDDVKNIIGTFQQPKAVIIDIQTLATLPKRILIEGFGEIIKHGLITNKKYFSFVTSKKPEDFSQKELIEIIARSCEIKAAIVKKDTREKDVRKLLNFGHTIAHALEAASFDSTHPLLHGEAVAIGIVAESYISLQKKMLSKKEFEQIVEKIGFTGLPTCASGLGREVVLKKMLHDKKQMNGKLQWTLLKKIGNAVINQEVPDELTRQAIEKVIVL